MFQKKSVLMLSMLLGTPVFGKANISCKAPELAKKVEAVKDQKDVYRFHVVQNCTLSKLSKKDFNEHFQTRVKNYISNAISYKATKNTEAEKNLVLTNEFKSEKNGTIKTEDIVTVKTDGAKTFSSSNVTKSILKASGNMEQTRRVEVLVSATLQNNDVQLTVQQIVDIKKPMIAPYPFFESGAKSGVEDSTKDITKVEADLLAKYL